MNDQNKAGQSGNTQTEKQDDTALQSNTITPDIPQQGKVKNIEDDTKLENDPDSGDLNDDD